MTPGPFYTDCGPARGPALWRRPLPAVGVFADRECRERVGMAMGGGSAADPGDPEGPAWQWWELHVGNARLPGRWALVGREFRRLGD
jgi:hypothetical protein